MVQLFVCGQQRREQPWCPRNQLPHYSPSLRKTILVPEACLPSLCTHLLTVKLHIARYDCVIAYMASTVNKQTST